MTAEPNPEALVSHLANLVHSTEGVEVWVDSSAAMEPAAQADAIALVQDLRKRLGALETDLAITLGKAEGQHQGNLSDGRQFTLKRTAERKSWNHEDWKRDARRKVTEIVTTTYEAPEGVVDLITGETATLATVIQEALTVAQEVHGSTAPRSTALKRLGLYASDYAETSPGGWKFDAIAPHATTTED